MSTGRAGMANGGRRCREAIDWLVANESDEDLHRATLLRWENWCASSENRAHYAEVIRLQQQTGTLPRPPLPSREELLEDLSDEPSVAAIRPESAGTLRRFFGRPHSLPGRSRIVITAAWVALLAFAIAWFFPFGTHWPSPATNPKRSYATVPGEQREFTLPDGSRIKLGGDSALVVRFTPGARTIELDRGEAFFRVQHDARRPFVVHAAGGTTTAVGTAFEVRRYVNHVQVWVREGAVEVAPLLKEVAVDDTSSQNVARWIPVRLARGEEMTYAQGEASAPHPADPRLAAAWAEGHLVPLIYRGRPLPDVIEDVQPYTRRRIMIDPAAADLRYSGIVIQEDVDAWIRDLPTIYPDVDVIDCRTAKYHVPGCSDPERIIIRSRLNPHQDSPQSALR